MTWGYSPVFGKRASIRTILDDLGDSILSPIETKPLNERQEISKEMILPLKGVEFLGHLVEVSAQTEKYIEKRH